MASPEILMVLADEIDTARPSLDAAFADFTVAVDDVGRVQAIERYMEEVERIRLAAEMLGLEGLAGLHVAISEIAMIYQEPMASLNPAMRIGQQLMEVPMIHERISEKLARARAP